MTVQEKAFRAYYASMTDAELLKTAANRGSFLEVAQQALEEELQRRNLKEPEMAAAAAAPARRPFWRRA